MKKNRGFTLVELVVVMAIVAVLVALAIFLINATRMSARNTQRRTNIRAFVVALEGFRTAAKSFPDCNATTPGAISIYNVMIETRDGCWTSANGTRLHDFITDSGFKDPVGGTDNTTGTTASYTKNSCYLAPAGGTPKTYDLKLLSELSGNAQTTCGTGGTMDSDSAVNFSTAPANAGGGGGGGTPPPDTEHILTLTLGGTGTGSVSTPGATPASCTAPATCTHTYTSGGSKTLTATATGGSSLAWGGACSGTPSTSPCNITTTLGSSSSVSATFTAPAGGAPTVVTGSATSNGAVPARARLTATANPNGFQTLLYFKLEGPSGAGKSCQALGGLTELGATIPASTPNSTYAHDMDDGLTSQASYFCAYAINSIGTTYGSVVQFTSFP